MTVTVSEIFFSVFWFVVDMASITGYWVVPVLFLVACGAMARRYRSPWIEIALLGSVLSVGERLVRAISSGIHLSYELGRQPVGNQNFFEFFFFLHGGNFGYMLVSIGLLGFLFRR